MNLKIILDADLYKIWPRAHWNEVKNNNNNNNNDDDDQMHSTHSLK